MRTFSSVLVILLSGCASMYAGYTPRSMVNVAGETRRYEPVGAPSYVAEDENVRLSYTPDIADAGVGIVLENKTKTTIRVIWDESLFIDSNGKSERLVHEGVKLADRAAAQPPTAVLQDMQIADDVVPVSRVDWKSGSYGGGYTAAGGWEYVPICGTKNTFTHRLDDVACVGKTFGIAITYEKDGKKRTVTARYRYAGKADSAARTTAGK